MKRLSGMDASFLYMETPSAHSHVVGTIVLDPSTSPDGYSFEKVVQLLRDRLHLLEPFRRRLVTVPFQLSHPVWIEDPDFDLENHVHRTAVRPPGTMHELAEIVGDIAGRPLDRSRPLWDLWMVEGLEDGQVALVTKMHHAAIDGVTGADLMAHLFDLTADAPPPPPPETPWQPEPVPSDLELTADAMRYIAGNPARLMKIMRRTIGSIVDVVQQASAGGRRGAADAGVALPGAAGPVERSHHASPRRRLRQGHARRHEGGEVRVRHDGQRRRRWRPAP